MNQIKLTPCWPLSSRIPLLLAISFASSLLVRGDVEDRIQKSFNVASKGTIIIDVDRGSIDIKTADVNKVEVEVIREANAEAIFKEHQVNFSQEGNDVRIQSRFKGSDSGFWNRNRRLRVRYVLSVPIQYNADLKTSGGSISLTDLNGKVRARTSGGSLNFGQIQGPVWGRTSGGNITLAGSTGTADVETSGGNLKIGEVDGPVTAKTSGGSISIKRAKGEVLAETSGGSINVEDALGKIQATTSGGAVSARLSHQPNGDCVLKTSGGGIDVRLGEKVAVNLDASTSGGRVISDMPVTIQGEIKKTALKTQLNGGGPALVLHTSGGNVHIRKL
jgi:DUF4097 and DUF4098 domain-containing protein YvlB